MTLRPLLAWAVLAASWACASTALASPADKYLKAAQKLLDKEKYAAAEKQLLKAEKADKREPEVHKGLFWVNVTRYKLPAARKDLQSAITDAKKKAAKFKTGKAAKLWKKYLADLYSLNVELTILENEKALSPKLQKGGPETKAFKAALARVQRSYKLVAPYGRFISSIDDPIVDKTLDYMLARMPASARGPSGGEAAPAPRKGRKPRGQASTAREIRMEGDDSDGGDSSDSGGSSD